MPSVSNRNGKAGLAHTSRTDQGQKMREVECTRHSFDIALPADQTAGGWQTGNYRPFIALNVSGVGEFLLNLSYKLVSTPRDRRDVSCMRKGVFKDSAKTADVDLQIGTVDEYVGPREFDQLVLADLLASPRNEQMQNVQRSAAQLHRAVP